MGIRKSTVFLAVLIIALAATSIGLLIALLLAKQQTTGLESGTNVIFHFQELLTNVPVIIALKNWLTNSSNYSFRRTPSYFTTNANHALI